MIVFVPRRVQRERYLTQGGYGQSVGSELVVTVRVEDCVALTGTSYAAGSNDPIAGSRTKMFVCVEWHTVVIGLT